jgi:hypothetical protein
MYNHIANTIDPLLASVSTVLIVLTLVLMAMLERFYGLDRILWKDIMINGYRYAGHRRRRGGHVHRVRPPKPANGCWCWTRATMPSRRTRQFRPGLGAGQGRRTA